MKNTENKSAIQIMYETVMERGGPQGPFSQAVVNAYKGIDKDPKEQKAILQFAGMGSGIANLTKKLFNKNKKYMAKEELGLSTEDVYGISAEEIDSFNKRNFNKNTNKDKKRYIVKENLDLDTEDVYGISAEEIDNFNKKNIKSDK